MLRFGKFFDFVLQFSEYRNNCAQNLVKRLGKIFKNAITQCFFRWTRVCMYISLHKSFLKIITFPKLIVENCLYKKLNQHYLKKHEILPGIFSIVLFSENKILNRVTHRWCKINMAWNLAPSISSFSSSVGVDNKITVGCGPYPCLYSINYGISLVFAMKSTYDENKQPYFKR